MNIVYHISGERVYVMVNKDPIPKIEKLVIHKLWIPLCSLYQVMELDILMLLMCQHVDSVNQALICMCIPSLFVPGKMLTSRNKKGVRKCGSGRRR